MVVAGDHHILDVPVDDAWKRLATEAASVLIDVRTKAEWAFVGTPDLTSIGKRPVLLEWQTYPDGQIDPRFVAHLNEMLGGMGADRDSELLFLCRSGVRSLAAARVMAAEGYTRCRNVAHGFEGSLDPTRHRGKLGGWKANGLPWIQS